MDEERRKTSPSLRWILPKEARTQLLTLLALVFLCGFLSGALSRRLFADMFSGYEPEFEEPNRIFFERFSERYGLDREQRRELEYVLEERDRRRRGILENWRRSLSPELRHGLNEHARKADARIRMILTPEQRTRYLADLQGRNFQ